MSDFLDDPPPKGKPAGAQPAVDPFAEQPVELEGPAKVDPFAGEPVSTKPVADGPDPFADLDVEAAEQRSDYEDPAVRKMNEETSRILRGGSGKSLWACPHCGAKNKPARDACRSCGKRPDDAVAIWKKPWFKSALIGVPLLVIILVFSLGGGVDLSCKAARASNIDSELRKDDERATATVAAQEFAAVGHLALCGRVLRAEKTTAGTTTWRVVVIYGDRDRLLDAETWGQLAAKEYDKEIDVTFAGRPADRDLARVVLLHILDPDGLIATDPGHGDLISFSGLYGSVTAWEWTGEFRKHEYLVLPTGGVRISSP